MQHEKNSKWNTETINLQLIGSNCKPLHKHAYTVPISVEQKLQERKEIVRLVDIEVLEEEYSFEWPFVLPIIAIPKKGTIRVFTYFRKLNSLLKRRMSPASYSKDWVS
jgi:hypothetical protein